MKYIESNNSRLEIGSIEESSFNEVLGTKYKLSKKVIIVDENTHINCLEYLITTFEQLKDSEVIVLPAGEMNKELGIVNNVWEALTDYGVTRHDLIINLGGGMITDMGGFIASCYKRGVDYINIPTSLLGMVDASIGGKTGINLGEFKNQVGVFSHPEVVYIDVAFLATLPSEELLSGYGEMLKHGLISDETLFDILIAQLKGDQDFSEEILLTCIGVKNEVVLKDPLEKGLRKILNFGHTIGHVIEGHFMNGKKMTHGHCVAIGMVMESYISLKIGLLDEMAYDKIQENILAFYEMPLYSNDEINEMVIMLSNDKKNRNGKILCSLLSSIGTCKYDQPVTEELFVEAFLHFKNLQVNLN
ncbi:MAG: 3-dehydroquinate synthase [Crocinitomicaceae bacterium]|jgi:3-dehydroquinate synthase